MGSLNLYFRFNLVSIYEKQVVGPMLFNPFVSIGYSYGHDQSDWLNQGDYPPTGVHSSNEIIASIGVEPTAKIFERIVISTKFGCIVSKNWTENNTYFVYPGDPSSYYRRNNSENISYNYFGPKTLMYVEFALHWVIPPTHWCVTNEKK